MGPFTTFNSREYHSTTEHAQSTTFMGSENEGYLSSLAHNQMDDDVQQPLSILPPTTGNPSRLHPPYQNHPTKNPFSTYLLTDPPRTFSPTQAQASSSSKSFQTLTLSKLVAIIKPFGLCIMATPSSPPHTKSRKQPSNSKKPKLQRELQNLQFTIHYDKTAMLTIMEEQKNNK